MTKTGHLHGKLASNIIHSLQRMNPFHFGPFINFPLAQSSGEM